MTWNPTRSGSTHKTAICITSIIGARGAGLGSFVDTHSAVLVGSDFILSAKRPEARRAPDDFSEFASHDLDFLHFLAATLWRVSERQEIQSEKSCFDLNCTRSSVG